jgi:DNA repair exonuclease SbcCD nuclease subunit
VVEGFKELSDAGVEAFILAGNHEAPSSEMDGASPHAVLAEAGLAKVFDSYSEFKQYNLTVDGVDLSIAGMSYNRNLNPREDPLEDRMIPAGAELNIAVLHYSIEGIAPPIWEEPSIKRSSIEANSDIQLYAMGHIHQHYETKVNDSHILYPGGTERYNFGECDKKTGFIVVDYDSELDIRYIPTEPQPMNQVKLHTSHMDHGDINGSIIRVIEETSHEDDLFQLVLEGSIPFQLYTEIDFTAIYTLGRSLNFFFEYVDTIQPTGKGFDFTPSEGLIPRKRLEETAMEAISKSSGEEQKIWQQAMDYALTYYLKEKDG